MSINNNKNEFEELKEIVNNDKLFSVGFIKKIHPKYKRYFSLYVKFIPIDSIDYSKNQRTHSLVKELLTYKKALSILNSTILLNFIAMYMAYLGSKSYKTTSLFQLSIGSLYLFTYSYFTNNYFNFKFCYYLNYILKDEIKILIENSKTGNDLTIENDISKLINKQKISISLVEFYSKWFYGSIDRDVENDLYFKEDHNGDIYTKYNLYKRF